VPGSGSGINGVPGSGSGFNGVPGSVSGSRRAKMTHKNKNKKFFGTGYFLFWADGFSCKLQFLIEKG
jgi:hypothetical protein